ncbi:MAG: glycosyltransferase, partial [Candidatus Latescibacteria bacterium]|nr:glycosyltransferase [Candidatus Latescibacterota bacterium]NIO77066.1 glycosyltransferase [Candidatus Latescibacterota bacterium]
TDGSLQVLRDLVAKHPWVRSIQLRKNSGKSLALMTAFRYGKGDFIVTMDGDL